MPVKVRRYLLFVVALIVASGVSAQLSVQPAQPSNSRIDLHVVVTRKSGPPVGGLQQQDFTILDNKVPQTITSFKAVDGSKEPIEVLVVIDTANADYHTVAYERDQIDKFLRADGGDLAHPTTLVALTDTGLQAIGDFSKDGNKLSASLDQYAVALRFINRSDGFYGAAARIEISLEGLHKLIEFEASRPGRKMILWVSPGWPFISGPGIRLDDKKRQEIFSEIIGFSTDLSRGDITLYSVDPYGEREPLGFAFYWETYVKGVRDVRQATPADLALQVLATQSGGVALNGNNDLTALLRSCLSDAKTYYELSFDPRADQRPNEYHHLEIRVAQHGLTARTRQGYYSKPEIEGQ